MIVKHVETWPSGEGHPQRLTLEWSACTPHMVELVQTDTLTLEEWRHGTSRPRLVECLANNLGVTSVPQVDDVELFAYVEHGRKRARFITRPHRADRQDIRVTLGDVRDLVDTAEDIVPLDREAELAAWKREPSRWGWIPEHAGCDDRCRCRGANTPSGGRG